MSNINSSLYGTAISGNPIVDNGGTILMGGNADSSVITNAPGIAIIGAGAADGNKPYKSAHVGTTTANSGANFATQTEGNYIVKGGGITSTLGGVAYTGLNGPGNPIQVRGINSLLTRKTVLIDSWNYVTGAATYNVSNPSSDSFDTGSYANPTRAIPGNLVTITNGSTPSTIAYEEKTN